MARKPAASSYEKIRMQTLSGRDVEAAVLEKAAFKLRRAQNQMKSGRMDEVTEEALDFNKRIWDVLRADWQDPDSHLPKEMRQNLLSLAVFIVKQGLELRADPRPERLNSFININESLAQGLRARAQ
ncbi:MAG: flagellar biosynthesis regulator FlaF [Verrucomicrobiota bacterium JB022]|nr:flagellar biosynthesis regulator FlaF [Verrucomicrobiota bacterium JB022]